MNGKIESPWIAVVILSIVAAMALGVGLVPGLAFAAWPFAVVLLGILARTVFPFGTEVLTQMKETGQWPAFERQFYVPLVASIGLDLLGFVLYLATSQGAAVEISTLGFTVAFLIGYGGAQVVRDGQKFVGAVTGAPRVGRG
jgi:hypothetical protein